MRADLLGGLICASLAAAAGLWLTWDGMVTFNDSAAYLSVAQHLTHGQGITAASPATGTHLSVAAQIAADGRFPMSAWPPGYPLILAAVMAFGASAMQAARVVSVFGGALLGAGMFLFARRLLGLPRSVGAVVAALAVIGPNVGLLAFGPMSGRGFAYAESIFVPLVVVTLAAGVKALQKLQMRWVLITCALIIALTLLRDTGPLYGFALLAGVVMSPGSDDRSGRRSRLVTGALFVGMGVATTLIWQVTNRVVFDSSASIRHFDWYGASTPLASALRVLAGWFGIPWSAPPVIHAVVASVAVILPVTVVLRPSVRRRWWSRDVDIQQVLVVLASAAVLSVMAVVATGALLDKTTLADARHLAPAQPLVYLLDATVLYAFVRQRVDGPLAARRTTRFVVAAGVLCGAWAVWLLPSQRADLHETPLQTAALGVFAQAPDNVRIVTNASDELWLLTGRTSLVLPPVRYFTSGAPNPDFRPGLDRIADLAESEPVIVATSRSIPFPSGPATRYLVDHHGFVRVTSCGPAVTLWAVRGSDAARLAERLCDTDS